MAFSNRSTNPVKQQRSIDRMVAWIVSRAPSCPVVWDKGPERFLKTARDLQGERVARRRANYHFHDKAEQVFWNDLIERSEHFSWESVSIDFVLEIFEQAEVALIMAS